MYLFGILRKKLHFVTVIPQFSYRSSDRVNGFLPADRVIWGLFPSQIFTQVEHLEF